MRAFIAVLFLMMFGPGLAADAIIKDGDSLTLNGTAYRLDGIDAPERDQVCLDEKEAEWACGNEVRDRLAQLIGKRAVRCEDKGPDRIHPKKRRIGVCWVEGETMSLNQWLVRDGLALNFEPYAKGRFEADEADARKNLRGLWKGCFSAPQDLRRWNKSSAPLLGPTCGIAKQTRNRLFPALPAMPPGCTIKGKIVLRAQIMGYLRGTDVFE